MQIFGERSEICPLPKTHPRHPKMKSSQSSPLSLSISIILFFLYVYLCWATRMKTPRQDNTTTKHQDEKTPRQDKTTQHKNKTVVNETIPRDKTILKTTPNQTRGQTTPLSVVSLPHRNEWQQAQHKKKKKRAKTPNFFFGGADVCWDGNRTSVRNKAVLKRSGFYLFPSSQSWFSLYWIFDTNADLGNHIDSWYTRKSYRQLIILTVNIRIKLLSNEWDYNKNKESLRTKRKDLPSPLHLFHSPFWKSVYLFSSLLFSTRLFLLFAYLLFSSLIFSSVQLSSIIFSYLFYYKVVRQHEASPHGCWSSNVAMSEQHEVTFNDVGSLGVWLKERPGEKTLCLVLRHDHLVDVPVCYLKVSFRY